MSIGSNYPEYAAETASERMLKNASEILGVDIEILMAMLQPSDHRRIAVPLRLLGGTPIYVSDRKQARGLKATDEAYQAATG